MNHQNTNSNKLNLDSADLSNRFRGSISKPTPLEAVNPHADVKVIKKSDSKKKLGLFFVILLAWLSGMYLVTNKTNIVKIDSQKASDSGPSSPDIQN